MRFDTSKSDVQCDASLHRSIGNNGYVQGDTELRVPREIGANLFWRSTAYQHDTDSKEQFDHEIKTAIRWEH